MERQLYRSRTNRMVAGVCGGIAEYFGIDPTLVRLVWVLISLTFGVGFLAYIIAIIVIPERGYDFNSQSQSSFNMGENTPVINSEKMNLIIGGTLILLGIIAVARRFVRWIDYGVLWPVILIIIGGLIIYNGWRKGR